MSRKLPQPVLDVTSSGASEKEPHPPAEAERFAQTTLDALSAHICVLDENGVILSVNRAWREFAQANLPLPAHYLAGANYLEVCDRATGPCSAEAAAFAAGIRAVLRGEVEQFSLEYACPAPWEKRWFVGLVTRFPAADFLGVVVSHQNITNPKQAEVALLASEERLNLALSTAYMGVWEENLQTGTVFWSPECYQIFGVESFDGQVASFEQFIYPEDTARIHTIYQKALTERIMYAAEFRIIRPDGQVRWVSNLGRATYDENGVPVRVVGTVRDITSRKEAEEALRRSEDRHRAVTELISDFAYSCWVYPDGRVITEWVVGAFERTTGYTLEEVNRLDGGYMALIHPDDLVKVPDPSVLPANQSHTYEYRIITKGGQVRWLRDYFRPLEEKPEAGIWHILGAAQDITAHKQAEAALREREAQYRAVIETSADGFWIVDLAGRLLEVNDAYVRRSGYSRAELLTMHISDLEAQESPAGIAARIEQVVHHGSDLFQSRHRTKAGVIWPVEVNISCWPIIEGRIFVFVRDIQQRRRSEALLRTRLQLSELALQGNLEELLQSALAVTELYTGSQVSFFHSAAADGENLILQAWSVNTLATCRGESSKNRHLPISQAGAWADCFHTRTPVIHNDYASLPHRQDLPEGHVPITRELVVPLLRYGAVEAIMGVGNKPVDYTQADVEIMQELSSILMDVVARKQAEEALRQNQLNLQALIENTDGAIWSVDSSYRLIVGNSLFHAGMKALLGREVMPGEDLTALNLPQTHVNQAKSLCDRALAGETFSVEVATHLIPGAHIIEYRLSPIRTAAGQISGVTVFGRDITERKDAEATQAKLAEQLRQAHKMESVGRLAGGVAHDFNNLLTVIRGYSDLILAQTTQNDPRFEMTEQIRNSAERAAGLTRQLLAFSRRQVLAPVTLDLNELIANLNKMMGRLIGEDIALSILLQPGLWPITADPGQIEQVIINLVVNARDAMPTGGKLTIETRNVPPASGFTQVHPEAPTGPCVLLTISDTGHGIEADILPHIFEPFFTTKEMGQGTGLGLATVYGIVKQSEGDITVETELGRGTAFKIYLPAEPTTTVLSPAPAVETSGPHGSETILLVEDEAVVRGLVRTVLADQGYTLLEAGHGHEALALVRQHRGPIDMLLADVVMPEMSGCELAGQLKAQYPHLKVLFMSGYTNEVMLRHGLLPAQAEFLPKPFSSLVLTVKVRELLDK